MPKPKILIAEDEPDSLEIMSRKIYEKGYDVIQARDGEEALGKIYSEFPDVIVLDIIMPKMDGFEVLKRLRDNPIPHKWQPVIIVSAQDNLEQIKKGYNLEADYYITKPFRMNNLLKSIKVMLSLIPQRKSEEKDMVL